MKKLSVMLFIGLWILTGCATPPGPVQRPLADRSAPGAEASSPSRATRDHSSKTASVSSEEAAPGGEASSQSPPIGRLTYRGMGNMPVTVSSDPPEAFPMAGSRGASLASVRALVPVASVEQTPAAPEPLDAAIEGPFQINFDNADLGEVVRTLAGLLDIKYVLDPSVKGSVTIHTAGGLQREQLFPLFLQILEVNGLAAVKDGPLYRIASRKDASRLPIHLSGGGLPDDGIPFAERHMIQIIPLKHVSATEMSKLLAPFASEGATIVAHEATNTVVVVDKVINIAKVLKMADTFDIGLFERVRHRFYLLENATAKDTASMLKEIFQTGGGHGTVRFIPIERLNAVLALSADPQVFLRVDQLMIQLDAPGEGVEPRVYVYFVKNGGADELSGLLNEVFDRQQVRPGNRASARRDPKYGFSRNPFSVKAKQATAPDVAPVEAQATAQADEFSSAPRGDVLIVPDPVRNALIIEAAPTDYKIISDILARIDVLPRQVLIEAMIAEISLDDSFELGVEWEYTRERADDATGLLSGVINGDGLTYAVAFSQDLLHNLDALAAKNKVNILSSPHVLASDGKEAKIDVSNEIPIISSETVISSSAEPLVTTDIQYRDTGVLLSVTPHINENGLVTMDVYQEVSEQGEDVNVAGENYPSFFKRSVDTTLTVKHDQTIVLGGLIRENKGQNRSGVPGLIDIPGFGWLFGERGETYDKAELIILLTPKVITSLDDVSSVTEEFELKVGQTMQYIQEKQESSYIKP